jgi:hypothetical protein
VGVAKVLAVVASPRRQHLLGGQAAQIGDLARGGRLGRLGEDRPQLLGLGRGLQPLVADHRRAAFGDRLGDQAPGQGRGDQQGSVLGARRLAEHRYVLRVAAEPGDVVAHPLERRDLVEQAVFA